MAEIREEMETLVTDIVRDGSDVIIVGYYQMRNTGVYQYNECLTTAMVYYKQLAASSPHVTFVSTADVADPDVKSNYAWDEVHPSIELAQKIGKKVAYALKKK
jgi:hypothetical protein